MPHHKSKEFPEIPRASQTGRATSPRRPGCEAWERWAFAELRRPPHTSFCAFIARMFHVGGRGSFLVGSEARTQLTWWCRVCIARCWCSDDGFSGCWGGGGGVVHGNSRSGGRVCRKLKPPTPSLAVAIGGFLRQPPNLNLQENVYSNSITFQERPTIFNFL